MTGYIKQYNYPQPLQHAFHFPELYRTRNENSHLPEVDDESFFKWEIEALRCLTICCKNGQQQSQDQKQKKLVEVLYAWLPKTCQQNDRNNVSPYPWPVFHLALRHTQLIEV